MGIELTTAAFTARSCLIQFPFGKINYYPSMVSYMAAKLPIDHKENKLNKKYLYTY